MNYEFWRNGHGDASLMPHLRDFKQAPGPSVSDDPGSMGLPFSAFSMQALMISLTLPL